MAQGLRFGQTYGMLSFMLRRLLAVAPTALLVVALVGALLQLIPGDPVDALLGEQSLPADRAVLRAALGLDLPWWHQVGAYMAGLVQGDWGQSLVSGQAVGPLMVARLPATAWLAAAAMGVALVLGCLLGVATALARGWVKNTMELSVLALLATPSFVLGPLLVAAVAVGLNWLPVSGMQGPASLVLPALTLGTGLAMVLARFFAESLERVLASEPLRTAKAKGATPWRCLLRHAAPLAAGPVVQIIFLQLGMVLTGAVLTEAVFGWPGLGTLLVEALHQRDYPVLQGCLLFISLTYIVCLLLSDALMALLDPRLAQTPAQEII